MAGFVRTAALCTRDVRWRRCRRRSQVEGATVLLPILATAPFVA